MSARSASERTQSSGRMSLWAAAGGARVPSSEGGSGYLTSGLGGGAGLRPSPSPEMELLTSPSAVFIAKRRREALE